MTCTTWAGSTAPVRPAVAGGERSGDIRARPTAEWIAISERGRIPASVVAQWEAAPR
jgi:hypothetical protein